VGAGPPGAERVVGREAEVVVAFERRPLPGVAADVSWPWGAEDEADGEEERVVTAVAISARVAALLRQGFDLAGDGGMDPFTEAQRGEVAAALAPFEAVLAPEDAAIQAEDEERVRQRDKAWVRGERARLRSELKALDS
jgi:hypothetical protein